eukprot:3273115-Pyramimonas_sp.AAC.1
MVLHLSWAASPPSKGIGGTHHLPVGRSSSTSSCSTSGSSGNIGAVGSAPRIPYDVRKCSSSASQFPAALPPAASCIRIGSSR